MGKLQILCGQKFGRLNVGPRGPSRPSGSVQWVCKCDCGEYTLVTSHRLVSGRTKSCGCLRRTMFSSFGALHPRWTGGRLCDRHGYIRIRALGHPNVASNGYVLEHVKVMGEMVGRPLTRGETVHHRNGVRHDNRPENLELWASNHCSGQRVVDLVAHAKEVLAKYDPKALATNATYTPVFGRPPIYAQVK